MNGRTSKLVDIISATKISKIFEISTKISKFDKRKMDTLSFGDITASLDISKILLRLCSDCLSLYKSSETLMIKSPQEIMKEVASFFKRNGYSYDDVTKMLGYGSKQSLYNLLASKKYLSQAQARRFASVFPFSIQFLTTGEGMLLQAPDPAIAPGVDFTPYPSHAYLSGLLIAWFNRLTMILKDEDISELYRLIYHFAFCTEDHIDGLQDKGKEALEYLHDLQVKMYGEIGEAFEKINLKFKNGIKPVE